ncbi:MAG: hypothetical protein C0603_03055 [Denitrovibrio sp.]|nr:MAG: hypothetical protein C0603_03055 [Denitrovibrio sp.]
MLYKTILGMCLMRLLLLLLVCGLVFSCDPYANPLIIKDQKPEILIYTGITMADAISEINDIFESRYDCKASMMYGASGYLKRVIEVNKVGDIFFPGNKSYVDSFIKEKIVTKSVDVGFNRLSFFVKKGNPLLLSGDLHQLTDANLKVSLGANDSGSVGEETFKLIKQLKYYNDIISNVTSFTADSKGLVSAIRNSEADIVINWLATGFVNNNNLFMEPIKIDYDIVNKVPITMGILKYSSDLECVNNFMDTVHSSEGKALFKKYGFND